MSRLVGPIRQIGHIVHDLDEALRYWTETLGVGPFYVARDIRFEDFSYLGAVAPSPRVSLAFAQAGEVQIELIAQHDDIPSGYRDFLDSGREGAQHLAAWFADVDEYDTARRRLIAHGLKIRQEGAGPGPRFAYFSAGDGVYPELEIAEASLPSQKPLFDFIARQARDWDGSDPIRGFDQIALDPGRSARPQSARTNNPHQGGIE